MRPLAYASSAMLAFGLLVLVAQPADACPEPTSGTGLATCQGPASTIEPSTTEGPVCWNALCPGVESNPTTGLCAQVWLKGNGGDTACVPVSFSRPPDQ